MAHLVEIGIRFRPRPRRYNSFTRRRLNMATNLRAVIGKLNPTSRNALEGAAGLCLSRTNYNVEIEHFLMKLLDASGADFALIARHFGIDKSRVAAELNRSLDKLKSGSARNPAIGESVVKMLKEGWMAGSLDFNDDTVRTGYCILARSEERRVGKECRARWSPDH